MKEPNLKIEKKEESKIHVNQEKSANETGHVLAYRAELDGMRAVAILAVIFYHAGFRICLGGFFGVDIFFVLSGFLMTSIILKESENNEFTLLKFYERRVRRILPMLFFTIAACYYNIFLSIQLLIVNSTIFCMNIYFL
jgi:peptidoglycan/LPS O-acetylase OafA/YrhL